LITKELKLRTRKLKKWSWKKKKKKEDMAGVKGRKGLKGSAGRKCFLVFVWWVRGGYDGRVTEGGRGRWGERKCLRSAVINFRWHIDRH